MTHLLLFLFSILLYLTINILLLKKNLHNLLKFINKVKLIVNKKNSDDRAQFLSIHISKKIFIYSFKILITFIIIALTIFIINSVDQNFFIYLMTPFAVVELTIYLVLINLIKKYAKL